MRLSPRILIKSVRQLGITPLALYARYQVGLRSGYYRFKTPPSPSAEKSPARVDLVCPIPLPPPSTLSRILGGSTRELITEADEIVDGRVRLFGGQPVTLKLAPAPPLHHWSAYELGRARSGSHTDVKFVWEPARFGWAYPLSRAYRLTGEERYAEAFWRHFETFTAANPLNVGPNWASGQEVALRLIAMSFSAAVLHGAAASTPARMAGLASAVTAHAGRIPHTLVYARSQGNNHLISEAAGLYTAGVVLAGLPAAPGWRELGWELLNHALQSQIAEDGTYIQHSANYHRLMLQLALWCGALAAALGEEYPAATRKKLAVATRWLICLLDPVSGRAANLGANDGAYIQPLATGGFQDYRPVLQAAARTFLGMPLLPPGAWDEMSTWLGRDIDSGAGAASSPNLMFPTQTGSMLRLDGSGSWALLRAARFTARPSHADQLHVDLWWRGLNLAMDAGTYLYNGQPPWDNHLDGTGVHNTVQVDRRDQMLRAGRFLWLDWAQAKVIAYDQDRAIAGHDGYTQLGVTHQRSLRYVPPDTWIIEDQLLPSRSKPAAHAFRLQWLLPDFPWKLDGAVLNLATPYGTVRLTVEGPGILKDPFQIVRAGVTQLGNRPALPIQGWVSPTYGAKEPALSICVEISGMIPITLVSTWMLPADS
jgi:hypothetical protein